MVQMSSGICAGVDVISVCDHWSRLEAVFHRCIQSSAWGPQSLTGDQATLHAHGSNGILDMFCPLKRAVNAQ